MLDHLNSVVGKINAYFKDLYKKIGTEELKTQEKTLIGAINEVKLAAEAGVDQKAIEELLKEKTEELKSAVVGGATEGFDTLAEIETQIKGQQSNKLSVNEQDTLTTLQKNNALKALGVTEQNFKATFVNELGA